MIKMCEYGCEKEAKYPPRKGVTKWCCKDHFTKCPGFIKRANEKKRGRTWEETLGKNRANERRKENSQRMKNNTIGNPPWNKGKTGVYSKSVLQKMRYSGGKGIKGKTWEEIFGKEKAKKLKLKQSKKMIKMNIIKGPWNKNKKGCFNRETIKQMRLSRIRNMKKNFGQIAPNYNPHACKIIDEYGKKHNYNFQHAENNGEFHIKKLGYWVDGYDKEKNVVIEIDEPFHYDRDGNLSKRDVERQKEIEDYLNCKFIRIKI